MKIGIIDADLIGKQEHNFPNLASMKISGYHKKNGDNVKLIHFDDINPNSLFTQTFDKVYISKVFTDTKVPEYLLKLPFVSYGGTGFFYDKAPNLPDKIEHSFPDYDLYNDWIKEKKKTGKKSSYFKYYTDYSIGFTTRGCFRKCGFCVNRNSQRVNLHSPINEFLDKKRKKICLLDDNILGCGEHWERIFYELQQTNKPFQYKQGMDIRILSEKKAEILSKSKYDGDYIFAFDNIKDKEIIEEKLKIFRKYINKNCFLYVFCGMDSEEKYNLDFWKKDLISILERIRILLKYKTTGYIMQYYKAKEKENPFKDVYSALANYTNKFLIRYKTINEYLEYERAEAIIPFKKQYPEIAEKYFNLKFGEVF